MEAVTTNDISISAADGPLTKNVTFSLDDIYSPLTSFEELCTYGTKSESCSSKFSFTKLDNRDVPTCTLKRETLPLSKRFSDVKIQTNGRRYKTHSCPKTLVCHDMKGGYLDDRFIYGSSSYNNYAFRHWLQTDIFCYFSHNFVTVPPVMWINSAHAHGVKCIGTIITENKEGELLCQNLLESLDSIELAVEKLCLIARDFQFDGYLVNVENSIEKEKVPQLIEFVRLLSVRLKEVIPESIVLWYDSVTHDGELKWQDELNDNNQLFFEACDGIYLNYCWDEEKLRMSLENAGDRKFDVFVGVDVFGRGCFGGGGLDTCLAVEKVSCYKLSLAVFAPGWTFECHPFENFLVMDDEMWKKCAKYFYFRTLDDITNSQQLQDGELSVANLKISNASEENYSYRVLLSTDFNQGFGSTNYILGKVSNGQSSWYDLGEQSYQVLINCFRPSESNTCVSSGYYDFDTGFFGGGSVKITSHDPGSTANINLFEAEPTCPIWIPLNVSIGSIPLDKSKQCVIVMVVWKPSEVLENTSPPIRFCLEFMKPSLHAWKVIRLNNVAEQLAFEKPDETVTVKFRDFVPERYATLPEIQDIRLTISDTPYAESSINNWKISCFVVDVNHCIEWNLTAFRLGTQESSHIGLISLGLLSY